MKKILFILLVSILIGTVRGNDGVYLTHGGMIYPTKETKISMDKEILSFTVKNRMAYVDIQFQFNNPEEIDRKLMIGFQAPSGEGDISDSLSQSNQIKNFTIVQNGQILRYKLKAAECEECELKKPKDFHFSQFESGVFVFLFEITFKPGINQINHSYSFPASNNVAMDQFYNYILTTGSKWAGSKIKDLTINIDMGQNKYFYVNDIFGKAAKWSIVGSGKVTNDRFDYQESNSCRMVRTLNGYLQIKVQDFRPTKNIEFGIVNRYSFTVYPIYHNKYKEMEIISIGQLELQGQFTNRELRIMRNTIYAQYGYDFKNSELKAYFTQFEWYLPDPNLNMQNIVLTNKEKIFIDKILAIEK
ncbi:MAG: YARHG domain-containing protein [Flavobacteriales bacterium]